MKAFRFRLQRVLDLRQRQMEREEAKLQQALQKLAAIRDQIAALETERDQSARQLLTQTSLQGSDLAALAHYRERIRQTSQRLATDRGQLELAVTEQQQVYTEARRKVRLLEKLRERRQGEWGAASQQEIEEIQADSYLARWNREAQAKHRKELREHSSLP